MKGRKKLITLLGHPHLAVLIALLIFAATLWFYSASRSLVRYIAYALSVYILIAAMYRLLKTVRYIWRTVRKHPFANRLLTDISYKIQVSLFVSLIINAVYAVTKLVLGIVYSSTWFITLAIYYILLSLIRFLLLTQAKQLTLGENVVKEYQQYRLSGILLIVVNISLSGVAIQMVRNHQNYQYPGYLIYAAALYAFYAIIAACVHLIKYRRYNSPIISAAQAIGFTTALVSILSLQNAMLTQFNSDPAFGKLMSALTSGAVCVIIIGIAFFMIVRASIKLNDAAAK